ncbi:MAG: hypothetical protein ALECFALPRED_002464 [Alectoria fallacina]|uniref:Uncharacterized protein n=1 Tax=Alectoria fallacina TaxID=1903189 RepID=A0A8H3EHF9_9LECA|nr:MAG: hypothetical protein ALECFALPRED_002464 [Alectoria fallacina]
MSGQWPGFRPASDSGSIKSGNLQNDNDDASYPGPDLALIAELLENIDRNPLAQEAHMLLMQHYAMCGWHDEAKQKAYEVLEIDRTDKEAQKYLEGHEAENRKGKAKPAKNDIKSKGKHGEARNFLLHTAQAPIWHPSLFPILSPVASLQELENGYLDLLESARLCLGEMKLLKDLKGPDCEDQISDLAALAKGQVSSVVRVKPLAGVKAVTETIVADSKDGGQNGLNVAVKDLEELSRWLRNSGDSAESSDKGKSRSTGNDNQEGVREALLKRVKALKALLPNNLQPLPDSAMMHAEHEFLHRKYVNDETMTFDAVSDIPRSLFWTSEEGYAWDMEELARAITSGKGVMRNPLSKQMFTRADIKAIIQHPLGKGLQALGVEQSKLKRGVRPQTIDGLDALAKVLLVDMTEDGKPSHLAVEAFVSYLETLPSDEQQAIDDLKVAAKDSHTGMAFDMTIGEAVKDVQGNRVCSHKAGDFLAQAVVYLR